MAVVGSVLAVLNSTANVSSLTAQTASSVPSPIVDFNGPRHSFPHPAGPCAVAVQHVTFNETFRHFDPRSTWCTNVTTLPLLREKYGEDGASYFDSVCSGYRQIQASFL